MLRSYVVVLTQGAVRPRPSGKEITGSVWKEGGGQVLEGDWAKHPQSDLLLKQVATLEGFLIRSASPPHHGVTELLSKSVRSNVKQKRAQRHDLFYFYWENTD